MEVSSALFLQRIFHFYVDLNARIFSLECRHKLRFCNAKVDLGRYGKHGSYYFIYLDLKTMLQYMGKGVLQSFKKEYIKVYYLYK